MVITLAPRTREEVQEEIKSIQKFGRKIRKTKKSARAFLLKHGFITEDNQLGPKYR